MGSQNFFIKIAGGFSDALHPLKESLQSPEAFESFITQFGWSFEDDQKSIEAIGQIFQNTSSTFTDLEAAIKQVSDPGADKILLLGQVLNDLSKIYSDIQTIRARADAANFTIYPFNQPEFWEGFAEEVADFLVTNYLEENLAILSALLYFFGVLSNELVLPDKPADRTPYISKKIQWDRIPKLFTHPGELFDEVYNWGGDSFNYQLFILNLYRIFSVLFIPAVIKVPKDEELDEYFDPASTSRPFVYKIDIPVYSGIVKTTAGFASVDLGLVLMPIPPKGDGLANPVGFAIYPFVHGKLGASFAVSNAIRIDLSEAFANSLFKTEIRPDGSAIAASAGDTSFDTTIVATAQPSIPWVLLGDSKSTRLELSQAQISIETKGKIDVPGSFEYRFSIVVKKTTLVVDFSEGDGFLEKIFGEGNKSMDFGFSFGWSSKTGFFFGESGNLEFCIPIHLSIFGVIEIESICVSLRPIAPGDSPTIGNGASFQTVINGSVQLGPIVITIQGVGLAANMIAIDGSQVLANGISLGKMNLDFSFRPPDGVGLSVDAGGIKGGGFLKYDDANKEYTGALELEFKDLFSLKAFGIITTKMPDGSDGFSLLIVITAEFTPVQLGFGFTLNGVGGLLGVNRTTKVDVLKQGIKTNAIESILFPQDVVANITRIISDIKQVFPPQQDHFLICPMGKIGWGTPTLVTLELGILIEIPSSGFKILGVLKALLPQEDDPLLRLQVNFLGEIDFDNKSISFIASLYDSRLLTFTLSGDMAFRILFGDDPLFLLSVGGFHPSFTQVPADLKDMKRLMVSLYDGDSASITLQSYFAVTSNTVQFGAKAELLAGSKTGFNIYGFVSYDVLFQFSPFHFDADLSGGVSLRHGTSVIMGISVSAELSGPSPWDAKGEASVSFFFFSISVPFHVSWGSSDNEPPKEKADLIALLTQEIGNSSNWRAGIPSNNKLHVSIKKITAPENTTVVHPFGVLTFSERLVPLGIEISRFGNDEPKDVKLFTIKPEDESLAIVPVNEEFAPANFFDMSDAEKLSRPSFEPMTSGFEITGSAQVKAPTNVITKPVEYELSYPGKAIKKPPRFQYPGLFFQEHTKLGAASQSSVSNLNNRVSVNAPAPVGLEKEEYTLATVSDMKQYGEQPGKGSYTEALQQYNNLIKTNPDLKDQLQILSMHEVNLN